jgi:RecA-family ATPase
VSERADSRLLERGHAASRKLLRKSGPIATTPVRKRKSKSNRASCIALTDWNAVRVERVNWLMLNRLPLAEVTIVEGPGGLGKTTAMLDVAARVSTGRTMPDGTPFAEPAAVILIAEEDRVSILKARLRAAGANLALIHRVSEVGEERAWFSLPSHAGELHLLIKELAAKLVIIDAMFNHVDSGLKINGAEEVRRFLTPLAECAHETGAAIVGIRHWGKQRRVRRRADSAQ